MQIVGVNWVMDVVDTIGGCWDGDPDRCTYPTTYHSTGPRVQHVANSYFLANAT
jgi:hypothetical protein